MTATLSQPDADRFSIFIDAVIESPRFNFSAFCKAAKLTADQALAWVARPDIAAALESCITFVSAAARIRHSILETNAMGALGELLRTSTNDIELRRAATTIISRHKADLRASRATVPALRDSAASLATDPSSDHRDIHREAVEVPSRGSPRSGIPGTASQTNPHPNGVQVLPTIQSTSPTRAEDPRGSASATPSTSHSATSASPSLSTQNSALSTSPVDPLLQLKLLADTLRLSKEPVRREPHSAKSLLNRAGATTAMSRDRPR